MLKIKDNIDLKELEKYGFISYQLVGQTKYKYEEKIGKQELKNIKIDDKRKLHFNLTSVDNYIPNVIYDLITDGLVEKIG